VVTVPHDLDGWVEVHPETVWATLSAFGADAKRLDGPLGMTAVLPTWGQTWVRHVHRHCLVPGGAWSAGGEWHPATSTYLFPVRALSRHCRGGFVSRLRQAYQNGRLPRIRDRAEVDRILDALMASDGGFYAKPCLNRAETVVDDLGRYRHRIALADSRSQDVDGAAAQLSYQDDLDGDRRKVMTLTGEELRRRFLLHVLPTGFMRVRHCGFPPGVRIDVTSPAQILCEEGASLLSRDLARAPRRRATGIQS
jgi:hypothetical protein